VLAVSGCGSSKGTVSGKVVCGGKAVVWGSVTLIASDNMTYAAQITPEGTYSVPNVPGGPVKICVTSPNPDTVARGGPAPRGTASDRADAAPVAKPPDGSWVELPEKYSDPEKSGLTGTVNGNTTIDLNLDG
jgi:hypothetical protein